MTSEIIGASIQVHRTLGPGLLESAYEACLADELAARGLTVDRQRPLTLRYGTLEVHDAYRLDLAVSTETAGDVLVEVKSVMELASIHESRLLTYLKISDSPVGLVINFNVDLLTKGIRRVVHRFPDQSPLRSLRGLCGSALKVTGENASRAHAPSSARKD